MIFEGTSDARSWTLTKQIDKKPFDGRQHEEDPFSHAL